MNQWTFGAFGVVIGAAVAWIVALIRLHKTEQRALAAEAEAGMLRHQQDAERQETQHLRAKLEGEQKARVIAETSLDAERKNLDQQHRLLNEAQLKLADSFKALSGDV